VHREFGLIITLALLTAVTLTYSIVMDWRLARAFGGLSKEFRTAVEEGRVQRAAVTERVEKLARLVAILNGSERVTLDPE
jgi:hypothetical protein